LNLLADIARDATVTAALRRDQHARPAPSFEEVRNDDVVQRELAEWAWSNILAGQRPAG
jgi:hypothetical protein